VTLLADIEAALVVPVIRRDTASLARAAAERMIAAGLPVVELTATTRDWPDALRGLRADAPGTAVGLGTVTDAATAAAALERGADFLVSPWPSPAVREVALVAGAPFLEGGFTPGELAAASAHGIAKLFPAHAVGAAYLRSVLAVLPGARIMPTGGLEVADVRDWLRAGATAVGLGSVLERDGALEQLADVLAEVAA